MKIPSDQKIKNLLKYADVQVNKIINAGDKQLVKELSTALEDINKQISEMYLKYGNDVNITEMSKYNRLVNLETAIADRLKDYLQLSKLQLSGVFKDVYIKTFNLTETALNEAFDVKLGFGEVSDAKLKAALDNPLDRVKWKWKGRMNGHTSKAVQQVHSELVQGIIQGKGYKGTAASIKGKVKNLENNVMRITRTETHRIRNVARVEGLDQADKSFKRLGIEVERVLMSVMDGKTREQSAEMNGQVADEDGNFTYPDGTKCDTPGNTGIAEYDINDREIVIVRLKK